MRKKIAKSTFAALALGTSLAVGAGMIGSAIASEDSKKLDDRSEYSAGSTASTTGGSALSMEQIVAKIKDQGFIEVYEVEREHGSYEVKARDTKGALMEIYVDAKTGEILKSKYED